MRVTWRKKKGGGTLRELRLQALDPGASSLRSHAWRAPGGAPGVARRGPCGTQVPTIQGQACNSHKASPPKKKKNELL